MVKNIENKRLTGGMRMATKIQWETDLAKALTRARKEDKTVLIDFFNPG